MSNKSIVNPNNQYVFRKVLTVLFIGLRITNQINWSLWLVFLPLILIPIGAIARIFFSGVIQGVYEVIKEWKAR